MTTVAPTHYCYNKGCGKQFDLDDNGPESCTYHPGNPVFHDAYKGWSCCNKRSTDFTQFLSFPGCAKGTHSNVKPPEPEKPALKEELLDAKPTIEFQKPPELTPRPDPNSVPLVELKRTVAPSLITSLEKLTQAMKALPLDDENRTNVPLGTPCKNSSCKAEYTGEESNLQKCIYHEGIPIFHEGMKYWSCCQRKTSDFDNFLNQVGCTEGKHVWFKEKAEQVNCKYDFFQAAGNFVTITIYAKNSVPEKCSIKLNPVKLDFEVAFEGGQKTFKKTLDLFGVVKVEESKVEFYQSKVEIKLKKADVISWKKLEYDAPAN